MSVPQVKTGWATQVNGENTWQTIRANGPDVQNKYRRNFKWCKTPVLITKEVSRVPCQRRTLALCQTKSLCFEQVHIWTIVSAFLLRARGSPVSMFIHILGGLHSNLQIGDVFRNHKNGYFISVFLLFYDTTSYLRELSGNQMSRSLYHNGDYCSRCVIRYTC